MKMDPLLLLRLFLLPVVASHALLLTVAHLFIWLLDPTYDQGAASKVCGQWGTYWDLHHRLRVEDPLHRSRRI
jgi:hypothetical protein